MSLTIAQLNEAGEKPLEILFNGQPLKLTYDQSEYTPELERKMNSEMRSGKPGSSLSILLMKLLRSWEVINGEKALVLNPRPGKFEYELEANGQIKLDVNGQPVHKLDENQKPILEKVLTIAPGAAMPLNERILDQCVGIFAMGKLVRAIMEDQRPNDDPSPDSDGGW